MDSIRFEPSISAIFAIDRQPSGGAGDQFADMLGDQMKKRADAERQDSGVRRRPNGDRRIGGEAHPAADRRLRIAICHAHELSDVATSARDVTPGKDDQAGIAPPAEGPVASMEDPAAEEPVVEAAKDEDQQTDQQADQQVQTAASAPIVEEAQPGQAVAIVIDPQAPIPVEETASIDVGAEASAIAAAGDDAIAPAGDDAIAPAHQPDATTSGDQTIDGDVQPQVSAAEDDLAVDMAADFAATLDDTVVGLIAGGDAAASSEVLASANAATLVAPKAVTSGAAEASEAVAVELAAKITPEVLRPIAESKPRPTPRAAATPNAEIKTPVAAGSPPNATATIPAAPAPALGEPALDGFDAALFNDTDANPGWALHLAQGAAARRPDFIAQLRQHLQELPAHEQIAVNIQRAMRAGKTHMTIDLSPAELGKIHVKLEIDEEKRVTAAVTVEKPGTLELLQRDVKALERALQEAGLKMERNDLSFSLGRQNGQGFAEDTGRSGSAGSGIDPEEATADADQSASQAAALVDTAAGLVNLQI